MFPSFTIRPEINDDEYAINELISLAFGENRHSRLINKLRKNCNPYQKGCFVAESNQYGIIGAIRHFMVKVQNSETAEQSPSQFPFLGPLAIQPNLTGQGIGKSLVRHSLQALHELNHQAILIVGDEKYYNPFGFSTQGVHNLNIGGSVSPLTFMALEWQKNILNNYHGTIQFVKSPNN